MTIHSVVEMWSREAGNVASSDGQSASVKYASAYQVEHSADATIVEILNADGIPPLRSLYPGTDYVYCTQVGDVQRIGPIFSIVPVQWQGEISVDGSSPLDQRAKWKLTSAVANEATDIDGFGNALTMTTGEPADGLGKDIWDWQLQVTQNFLGFNSYTLNAYANAVNSDDFGPPGNLWPPGTAHLQGVSIEPSDGESGTAYFKVQATILFRTPVNTLPIRAWWWRYRNEGYYERVGTNITFGDSPDGNNAAGYAVTSSGGAVTAIVVTNPGSGYVTAPTVTITSATGGTGATATATINSNGRVTGVSVGAGGTGYRSRIVRAVDDQKEPVSKPVLLAADGSRLQDTGAAFFNERPRYSFYLPFSALGFNF